MEATQEFSRKPLLSTHQVTEAKAEIDSMNQMLVSPHTQNKGQIAKQLRAVTLNYESQAPKPPANPAEEGRMVARSKWLLEQIVPAMCSQEEMRKSPPGSVDKFLKQENGPVIKPMIAEWQNLQKRLHPGETEAAMIERHRPKTSTLNMDNAIIPGKTFFMPPVGVGISVTFTEDQLSALRLFDPQTAEKLATMPSEARAEIKEIIQKRPEIKRKPISEKQKAALAEGRSTLLTKRDKKAE